MEWVMLLFEWIVKSSLLVIPVVLMICILRLGIRRISSALMCCLWLVVWIRLICPVQLPLSVLPAAFEGNRVTEFTEDAFQNTSDSSRNIKNVEEKTVVSKQKQEALKDTEQTDSAKSTQVISRTGKTGKPYHFSTMQLLCMVWLSGIVVLVVYQLAASVRLHRRLRFAVRREDGVYLSDRISSAFVVGGICTRIYLPFGMSSEEEEYILAHERAHGKRHDPLLKKICFAICIIYWFHPLVWLAYLLLCNDMELACDEIVLKDISYEERKKYALLLLQFASASEKSIPAYQVQFGKNATKYRIRHSMFYRKAGSGMLLTGIFVALFTAVLCMSGRWDSITPMKRGGNYTKQVQDLYDQRVADGEKISEKEKLQKIDELLGSVISDDFGTYTFQIIGTKDELLRITFDRWIVRPDSMRKKAADYSALLLALMPKTKAIQWNYQEVQYKATTKTVNLQFDWNRLQDSECGDSGLAGAIAGANRKDYEISASALQLLVNQLTYCEFGKNLPKKKVLKPADQENMQKELGSLPRSHREICKRTDMYIEASEYSMADSSVIRKKQKKLWQEFQEKTKKGETASIIIGSYNVLTELKDDEKGSAAYCYLWYDGKQYTAVYDFLKKGGNDSFSNATGKYLEDDVWDETGVKLHYYFISDDNSVSSRDCEFSGIYAGTDGKDPLPMVNYSPILQDAVK